MRYSGMAFQMLSTLALAVGLGLYLDSLTGLSFPLITLVLALGSIVGLIVSIIKNLPKY